MNWKTFLLGFAALLVMALVAYAFIRYSPDRPPDDGTSGAIDFNETGNIARDTPGLKQGVWHLVYERAGAPALSAELRFDGTSRCGEGATSAPCVPSSFTQGTRAQVEGIRQQDGTVLVSRLALSEPEPAATRSVLLYYYDPSRDEDASGNLRCSRQGLVPVERVMPRTNTPIQDAVALLLRGELTSEEKAEGITTEYPLPGVSLAEASLNKGALTLSFNDLQNRTSGGACRTGILWFQIEQTALQFPEVESVHFMPEYLFQP